MTPRPDSDAQFLHGLLEGIARIEAEAYAALVSLGAPSLKRIFTAGGGAQNPTWSAIRQRIVGPQVATARSSDAAFGMALLCRQTEMCRTDQPGSDLSDKKERARWPRNFDQLKSMTVVVADTGDMQAIEAFKPVDCTTNPTLILKAAEMEAYKGFVDEAVQWAGKQGGSREARISAACDRLAVTFGAELTKRVPGRVFDGGRC